MALFFHFGPNTFTDSEWGTGGADPSLFNPTRLNTTQWVQVAKDAGFNRVILTAKHHDGFCLWPSEYTDYSVKSSSWRNGAGDVVKELALSANEAGLDLGLYLSPWDRHEVSYGKTLEYNEFYMGQMTELLTRYGEIKEVWLDGAKGEGEKDMEYYFDCWFSLIHQLQPGAVIFSDAGPDTRWIGDEAGVAGSTCWSLFNRSSAKIGGTDPNNGHFTGKLTHPHFTLKRMIQLNTMKGLIMHAERVLWRMCACWSGVDSLGLVSAEDIKVLQEFTELQKSIFSYNLAKNALLSASSTRGGIVDSRFDPNNVLEEGIYTYWAPEENQSNWELYLDLSESVSFNVLQVQEPIQMGQRIIEFHLEIEKDGEWKKVINGTTVGYQRLLQFPTVESQHLKFVIDKSRADPLISFLGVYMDSFSLVGNKFDNSSQMHFNSSVAVQEARCNHFLNSSEVLRQTTPNHTQTAAL
ncbi:hypothetical protein GH714_002064 [Hevea brasiliensis]|uniref:alpha-L-fucosidase n=1 Tax=Hevea brasiliensis TaxID=3981 RepID=A0A6A6NB28_HEVBR|nr:hypothetical protein GH714_002064 [Hevea brasiliensis]